MKSMKTDGGNVILLLDSHEENFMVTKIILKEEHTDKYDILSVVRLIFIYSF